MPKIPNKITTRTNRASDFLIPSRLDTRTNTIGGFSLPSLSINEALIPTIRGDSIVNPVYAPNPRLTIDNIEIPGNDAFTPQLGSYVEGKGRRNVEVAPGITAIGATPTTPPEQKGVPQKTLNNLVQSAASPISGVKSIKLADGTKVEGITPVDLIQANGNNTGVNTTPGADSSFFDKAGSFLSDPRFGYITGKLAQAVNPFSPGAQAAGQIGVDLAKNRALDNYNRALRTGEGLDNPQFNILSQEEKQGAVNTLLAEKGQTLTERRQAALEPYYAAQTEEAKARTAGYLTREDKLNNEAIDRAARLQIAKIGDNNWMNVGQGFVFNIDTGEIKKVYDSQTGGSIIGNIKSADYNQFLQLTSSTYLPVAIANRRAQVAQEQGADVAKLIDFSQEFTDPNTGAPNFAKIMNNLSADQRIRFAQDLNQYVTNLDQGVGRTQTFFQQEAKKNAPVLLQIQQLGGQIQPDGVIKMPDGKQYKLLPNGNLQELK